MISTSPLGSCVAVIAFDKTTKTGGIAHIMLPGKSPTEDKAEENKYAENAIENLLDELKSCYCQPIFIILTANKRGSGR